MTSSKTKLGLTVTSIILLCILAITIILMIVLVLRNRPLNNNNKSMVCMPPKNLPLDIKSKYKDADQPGNLICISRNELHTTNERASNIRHYLQSVYPAGKWTNISIKNLYAFYNSLGYYYNPCSKYWNTDLSGIDTNEYDKNTPEYGQVVCGTTWNPLDICESIYAPRQVPVGQFYSFLHYHKTNQASVWSDGSGDMADWTSFRQTLHWGISSTAGEISRSCRSGPGPYWIQTYSLVRDMYFPNGIFFKDGVWSVTCRMSPSMDNFGCTWNQPRNWTSGFKEGEYIEVSHAQNNPGMAQSIGFWFNGFPSGGTGTFLKIGKTHVGNNKVDTLFTLTEKLKSSSAADLSATMENTTFKNMSGSEILNHYYQTDDPYTITWKYVNGEWGGMGTTANGQFIVSPDDPVFAYVGNKGVLNASGLMSTPESISTSGPDGHGYMPNMTVKFQDIALWWLKQKGIVVDSVTDITPMQKNMVIDAARNPADDIDYFPNRAGGMVPPDEPICWLSFVLGIETIQMPMSANDNGMWCYEIIDLRIPTPENTPGMPTQYTTWLTAAKQRQYLFIEGGGSELPYWNPDAQGWWMQHVQNSFLSSIDPLDQSSSSSSIPCNNISYITGLNEAQCTSNPIPNVPEVPGYDSGGYYDVVNRCWVAVSNMGWQNLACVPNTLPYQYVKIPLMYPHTNIPYLS